MRAALLWMLTLPVWGFDLNEDLISAARKGDLAATKKLLEQGAAIETKTSYGQTPLYLAAMQGHEDVVRFLLEKGANTAVTDTFYKAPMLAFVMQRKHFGIAKLLIEKGAYKSNEVLPQIISSGQADIVQFLIDRDKPSQAVLDKAYEQALERKSTAVADVLKKAGANEPAPAVAVDPKVLESYVGTYKSEKLPLDIKITVKGDRLAMQASGQAEFYPKAKSPTLFEFAPAGLTIEFQSSSSFLLKQGGMTFPYQKAVTQ